jgi:hypothetical protein
MINVFTQFALELKVWHKNGDMYKLHFICFKGGVSANMSIALPLHFYV